MVVICGHRLFALNLGPATCQFYDLGKLIYSFPLHFPINRDNLEGLLITAFGMSTIMKNSLPLWNNYHPIHMVLTNRIWQ